MRRHKRSPEEINARCVVLESLGFEINHQDSSVGMLGVDFDFSAVELSIPNIIYHALSTMQKEARKEGRNEVREKLAKLMEVEE